MKHFLRRLDRIGRALDRHKWIITAVAAVISTFWVSVSAVLEGLGPTLTIVAQTGMAAATSVLVFFGIRLWSAVAEAVRSHIEISNEKLAVAERQVIDLGVVDTSNLELDLARGSYFRAKIANHVVISVTNPPPPGVVGEFDLELTNTGYAITTPASMIWPHESYGLSSNGTDLISGKTTDGGQTWRVSAVTGEYVRESVIQAREMRPSRINGCELYDLSEPACLRFDDAMDESAEWQSIFPHVSANVRLRFKIDWSTWNIPKTLGTFGAVFQIYGPMAPSGNSNHFVRIEVEMEVLDIQTKRRRLANQDWSEFSRPFYISPSECYRFRIMRDVSDQKDTIPEDVNIEAIHIQFVGLD